MTPEFCLFFFYTSHCAKVKQMLCDCNNLWQICGKLILVKYSTSVLRSEKNIRPARQKQVIIEAQEVKISEKELRGTY